MKSEDTMSEDMKVEDMKVEDKVKYYMKVEDMKVKNTNVEYVPRFCPLAITSCDVNHFPILRQYGIKNTLKSRMLSPFCL